MLVVTFGRAASQELRERVRAQLVAAERALADPGAVADHRRPGPAACRRATTSSTCGRRRLATRSRPSTPPPSPPPTSSARWCCARSASPATPTPARPSSRTSTTWSPRSSTTSTSRAFARPGDAAVHPRRGGARSRATVVADPHARLEPDDADAGTPRRRGSRFATAVRAELERRKRRLGILGYDDLLSRLAAALDRDDAPAAAADARPVADRAGRRVPGHRPGAVAGARPGLRRRTRRWC